MGPDPDGPSFDRAWPTAIPLHILGTDKLGRDILSRGIIGSRITLIIALTSITLITVVGTLLGITSGYIGGHV